MAWLNLIHENCLLTIKDTYYKTHFHLIYAAYLFLKIFLVVDENALDFYEELDYMLSKCSMKLVIFEDYCTFEFFFPVLKDII